MKLRQPVDRAAAAAAPVCRECGRLVTTILQTRVDATAGVVHVVGLCPADHYHVEVRPLSRPAGHAGPTAPDA